MFREKLRSLHLMELQFPSCFCPIHTIEFLDCPPHLSSRCHSFFSNSSRASRGPERWMMEAYEYGEGVRFLQCLWCWFGGICWACMHVCCFLHRLIRSFNVMLFSRGPLLFVIICDFLSCMVLDGEGKCCALS
jgi:hypothetical protein